MWRIPCYNATVKSPSHLASEIHRRLLEIYGTPQWRNTLPPLDELISTILSQNTNDANRDRAYTSLRARFPTWEEVRDADPQEVIDAIRTAGLANQKGPRIQAILRSITEERGELDLEFLHQLSPEEVRAWLLRFPGVGPKTTAIVMQFSLDMPAFPVDTHIYRLSGRIGLRDPKINADATHEVLASLFPPETYHAAHLNMIRHGREVCHARQPNCSQCVLQDLCQYYQTIVKATEPDEVLG
ncbi:MAG: endonuclease III [Anaerolineales bacterium]|nr:endonuclease III [Anaerolineales bacterium]